MLNAARIGGGILVLAGIYQLTPLKRVCLAKCRTPLDFILPSWREGYPGSFRMGLEHGIYCLGCNWLLFVLLFPLGIMNITAMVLLTALIFAEKSFPLGLRIAQFAALALILYGAFVIVVPDERRRHVTGEARMQLGERDDPGDQPLRAGQKQMRTLTAIFPFTAGWNPFDLLPDGRGEWMPQLSYFLRAESA